MIIIAKFLKVDIAGEDEVIHVFNRLEETIAQKVKEVVAEAAIETHNRAKELCPVDTGRLRSSIRVRFTQGGLAADVYTNVKYAAAVEYGVDHPVTIKPKNAKVLSWVDKAVGTVELQGRGGKTVTKKYYRGKSGFSLEPGRHFAKRVTIPPRKPRPFMHPAWEEVRPTYMKKLKEALNEASRDVS